MLIHDEASDVVFGGAQCGRQFGPHLAAENGIERVKLHAFTIRKPDGNHTGSMMDRSDVGRGPDDSRLIEFGPGRLLEGVSIQRQQRHGCRVSPKEKRLAASLRRITKHGNTLTGSFEPITDRTIADEPACDRLVEPGDWGSLVHEAGRHYDTL